jgi:hypothetical protein
VFKNKPEGTTKCYCVEVEFDKMVWAEDAAAAETHILEKLKRALGVLDLTVFWVSARLQEDTSGHQL